MKKIKYIFFGSPEFAEIVLTELLSAGLPPIAVVTNPDKPFGRKKILTSPPVRVLAEKNKIPVLQPEKITDEFISDISGLEPEMFVVAAYSKIIPEKLINIAKLGALGIHPSLLPFYRGASPIQGAILGGERETGVSIYLMDKAVDHGPVFAQTKVNVGSSESYRFLQEKLAKAGGKLVAEILPKVVRGEGAPVEQNHELATFTKKFKTEDGFISEEILTGALSGNNPANAELAGRIIRALNPDPGVWTEKNGKRIKLLVAEVIDGKLNLKLVQMEGKTPAPYRGGL